MVCLKAFAAQAIQRNVDKAQWEPLLKSLQQGIEIYREVYPGKDPAVVAQNKIITSDLTRFDGTRQLDAAAKTALANAINPLTTAQVLTREAGTLKDDMSLLALALPPLNLDIQLAGLTQRMDGSYLASFAASLTDPLSGRPMDGGTLNFTTRQSSITTDASSYFATGAFTLETTGHYRTTLVLPGSVRDVVLEGFGVTVQAWDIVATPVPEPDAWLLWLGGLLMTRWAAKRPARR